jgi:hypothetical protein
VLPKAVERLKALAIVTALLGKLMRPTVSLSDHCGAHPFNGDRAEAEG